MENSIITIEPYEQAGQWVFDDERVGLEAEPFVSGIPKIIDGVLNHKNIDDEQFSLTFSEEYFPDHDIVLEWRREDGGGNWYQVDDHNMDVGIIQETFLATKPEGWLCPALYKYYDEAPDKLYAKVEANNEQSH